MKRLIIVILLPLLIVTASAAAIVIDGLSDRIEKADVGVVLGSMVMPDGKPSPRNINSNCQNFVIDMEYKGSSINTMAWLTQINICMFVPSDSFSLHLL